MKILFVTGIYPHEGEELLRSLSGNRLQNAANTFQWAVIDGLVETKCDFEVVSMPFLPSYPMRYKKLYTPSADISYQGVSIGSMLSYCSLVGAKYFSIKQRLCSYVDSWIKKNEPNISQLVVLVYNLHPAYVEAIIDAIGGNKKVRIASIVTDLVDNMSDFASNRSLLKRLQCRIESYKTRRLYKNIDKYILLTQAMESKIPESKRRNIVVEGLVKPIPLTRGDRSNDSTMFLYTGALDEFTGVKDMVDAFMLTKSPQYKLVICGVGALEDYIRSKSRIDNRIEFRGVVPREECINLQHQTTCLINPRKPNGDITKYSFPSKTMEYMMSGAPMIGYRLEGIPSEYYEHMYTPNDMSIEALASMMEQVAKTEQKELNRRAARAYEFIVTHKTARAQVQKMLIFLNDTPEN